MKRLPHNRFEHRSDGVTVLFLERPNGDVPKCLVDTSDFPLVRDRRWYAEERKHTFYAKSSDHRPVRMHRLLLPNVRLIDHEDENGLNNRRMNLRPATHSQNATNVLKKRTVGTSQFRGVYKIKRNGKFGTSIQISGQRVWLGTFDSETEALTAYRRAQKLRGGNFAPRILNGKC